MRAAIYARYSSDLQSDSSIEDQIRLCAERAACDGLSITQNYTDHAISGASMLRPGLQQMLNDAAEGKFDTLYAEALDRLSRDMEHVSAIFKRLNFAGIRIITLSEGEVSELHVGLKGTMNQLFLKDLAAKTRRGLRGRVEKGKSGGGRCYGYDVVRNIGPDGNPTTGERDINPAEAKIVCGIFEDYANGLSPREIAKALNAKAIPSPSGKGWGASTIHGNPKRGTGIINNELYLGRLVWDRLRYLKDPETGRRVSRLNPESEWIVTDVPKLRIIDDGLWERKTVQQQKAALGPQHDGARKEGFWKARRPRHLLSGLVKCGHCCAGMVQVGPNYFGCSAHRNKGTCRNSRAVRQDRLETSIIEGLKSRLMTDDLVAEFCAEFVRETNRLREQADSKLTIATTEMRKVDAAIGNMIEAVKAGLFAPAMKTELDALEHRKAVLQQEVASLGKTSIQPTLHPALAKIYETKIAQLHLALKHTETRAESMQIIRGLIDQVVVTPNPEDRGSTAILEGDLAKLLTFAAAKDPIQGESDQHSTKLVAGVGFEPTTFRL